MRIASEFGFTPASRSRISVPPPDQLPLLELTEDDYEEEVRRVGGSQKSAALRPLTFLVHTQKFGNKSKKPTLSDGGDLG